MNTLKGTPLYMGTSGKAVLFTKTISPIDFSSSGENSGEPIILKQPGTPVSNIINNTEEIFDFGNYNGINAKYIQNQHEQGEEDKFCTAQNHSDEMADRLDNSSKLVTPTTLCTGEIELKWKETVKILEGANLLLKLKEFGLKGEFHNTPLRNIAWRLYVEVLPESQDEWMDTVDKQRTKYRNTKDQVIIDPHKVPPVQSTHPLSKEDTSPWNQYFRDGDLWQLVEQDVTRTWPEERIFMKDSVKMMMSNILFCYIREKPNREYRQGMHEILANILYMMETCKDQWPITDFLPIYLSHVLDPKFIEEDAASLFAEIMDLCDVWYESHNEDTFISKHDCNPRNVVPFDKDTNIMLGSTALSKKLSKIQNMLLKKFDPVLANHMDAIDISPQVYGIRWVRLLFGREFVLSDIMVLWDAMFALGPSLDLIDYIAVALLMGMRQLLLQGDQGECLLRLMKYPQEFSVINVINHALHLRDPSWPYNPQAAQLSQISPGHVYEAEDIKKSSSNPVTHSNPLLTLKRNTQLSAPYKMKIHKNQSNPIMVATPITAANNCTAVTQSPLDIDFTQFRSHADSNKEANLPPLQLMTPNPLTRSFNSSSNSNGNTSKNISLKSSEKISNLERDLELFQIRSDYCIGKLTAYVDHLQEIMLNCQFQGKETEDMAFLALAGIKQVRDVLKGQLDLGESSFGLDAEMFRYLRERKNNQTSKEKLDSNSQEDIFSEKPTITSINDNNNELILTNSNKQPTKNSSSIRNESSNDSLTLFTNINPNLIPSQTELDTEQSDIIHNQISIKPIGSPSHPLEYGSD